MRPLRCLFIFHRKLFFPALVVSLLLGLIGFPLIQSFSFKGVGISYMLFTPLFHYFIYEVRNPNEYYFYHNLGLSRVNLWISTFVVSLFIGTLLMSL